MGTLNLTSLISGIQRNHANRDDLTDQIIVDKLNLVQERIARLWDWEELDQDEEVTIPITSVAKDDKTITLVNTYKEIYAVRLVTGTTVGRSRKLTYIGKRSFDEMFPEPEFDARSEPQFYTVWKEKLELYRVPEIADTLVVRGAKWPADFSSGTGGAKSDFDRKDDILMYWTSSMIWDMLGEYERAKRFFGIAADMIDKAMDEQETKPDLEIKPTFEANRDVMLGKYWADPFIKWVR